jgi:hypothetical protein
LYDRAPGHIERPGKKDYRVETQGIVIWARSESRALIVWCADSGALVYVSDRQGAGDRHDALSVGDFVDLRVETVGAMRVGLDLRYRAAGAAWVPGRLDREARDQLGPVMSPRQAIAKGVGFGPVFVDDTPESVPANRPAPSGTGAA